MTSSNPATGPRRWLRKAWRRNPAHPKRSPNASVATSRSGGASRPGPASARNNTSRTNQTDRGRRLLCRKKDLRSCKPWIIAATLAVQRSKQDGRRQIARGKRERRTVAVRSTAPMPLNHGRKAAKCPTNTRNAAAGLKPCARGIQGGQNDQEQLRGCWGGAGDRAGNGTGCRMGTEQAGGDRRCRRRRRSLRPDGADDAGRGSEEQSDEAADGRLAQGRCVGSRGADLHEIERRRSQ